ncbi:MAG: D-inositol-3-phosphate glycosyltransferase [Myxococcota bacterium]|nr:D-inositol-3-phosphate glycosyltransferase [Myxococcota bacterium]
MKIILVVRRFQPAGGVEGKAWELAHGLHVRGHEVIILAGHIAAGAPAWAGKTRWRDRLKQIPLQKRLEDQLARMPEAIAVSFSRVPGAHWFRAGGGLHRENIHACGSPWKARDEAIARLEEDILNHPRLRGVAALSRRGARELEDAGVPASRIAVIPNGVDSLRFVPPDKEERARVRGILGVSDREPVALFVGGDPIRKGLDLLADALRLLSPRPVLITAGLTASRQRKVSLHGLRTVRAGERTGMLELLQAADVLVLPSRYEAFGNAPLEALACGVPAVISSRCGVAELFAAHGLPGIVEELSAEMLAGEIRAALERGRVEGHRRLLRRAAEAHPSPAVAERWERLLEKGLPLDV